MEYFLIYPESHGHLGLFEDLNERDDVTLFEAGYKEINSAIKTKIRRLHTSWTINRHVPLPFRENWFRKPEVKIASDKEYCVIVLDGAMQGLKPAALNQLFAHENVRGVLVLINSMEASSVALLESIKKFSKVHWDDVYSFDPEDVKKYGYKYLGCCYYSKHDLNRALREYPDERASDIYFAGGLKGGRELLMQEVFERLEEVGIRTNFNFAISGERRLQKKKHEDRINYYTGWIPYNRVLSGVGRSKVILEVLQNGQSGPSLRYYEAVCYGKKLLTNNPGVVDLPFYDERYMKVFSAAEDLDLEWICQDVEVDYHYDGAFSPLTLPERVLL